MWWSVLPVIDTANIQGLGGGLASTPTFRASVDCPSSLWSAVQSCPNIRNWVIVVGLGGLVVGYLIARR